MGTAALHNNQSQNGLVAIGDSALYANSSGYSNTAVGAYSLSNNTGGGENTAIGFWALRKNTTGTWNTALGAYALRKNTSGYNNIAVGTGALRNSTIGSNNISIGSNAMGQNTTGSENIAIGLGALEYSNDDTHNTAIGIFCMAQNGSSYKTGVGASAVSLNSAHDNSAGFGYDADPTAGNTIYLGNTSIISIKGQVGFTTYSDARFKTSVNNEDVKGLEFIAKLNPVTYYYDIDNYADWKEENHGERDTAQWEGKYNIEKIRFSGFIAQEVEAAAKEAGYDFSGVDKPKNDKDIYGLRYAEFVVPLVKAVQEQQAIIEELKTEIEMLKTELQR